MISARSLATNFSVQAMGKALSVLAGLITIALITRALGTTAFGEYTTATTYLQIFGVVVDFGLTLTLMVMISERGADEARVVGNFFGLRLVSGALLFSLAPLTILAFPYTATVKMAVLIGAGAYFLMGGATMLIGIFQKHESMWRAALAELLGRALLLILVALAAAFAPTVEAMVAVAVAANGLWLWVMIRLARPFVHIAPRFDLPVWREILSRSWPIAVSIFFNLLYLKGDILFLAYFREQSEVGLYGMAYRIIDVLTVLPVMFMGLVLPSLVASWSDGHKQEFRERVVRIFDVFVLAVVPVVVGAQLTATELTVLIAGANFAPSGPPLALLTIALIGVFFGALYGHLVVALNKQKVMTLGYVAVAIIAITGYLWLIPDYGMWGAIWVTLLSEGLIAALTFLLVWRTSGALPKLTVALKAAVAGGLMYLALHAIDVPVLIDILIGALIYAGGLLILRAVTVTELKALLPSK